MDLETIAYCTKKIGKPSPAEIAKATKEWLDEHGTESVEKLEQDVGKLSESITEISDVLNLDNVADAMEYDSMQRGFYNKGTFTSNTGYESYKYKCEPDKEYVIKAYYVAGSINVSICHYFNESGEYIGLESGLTSGTVYDDYVISPPSNCAYFIVVTKMDGTHSYANGYGIAKEVKEDSIRIRNLEKDVDVLKHGGGTISGVNVSVKDDVISITRPYSDTHNLKITMEKCGSSSLMQLKGFYFIAKDESSEDFEKISNTDWLGPYKVLADANPTSNISPSYYYTGGWHGANNSTTGYSVGETVSYEVKCDGDNIPRDGSSHGGNHVAVAVINHICGNNTCDTTGGNDKRYILEEKIVYDFSVDRCDVTNVITALEDIHIREYYGLQIASNSSKWMKKQSVVGTDIIDVNLNNQNISQAFLFNPQYLIAQDDDGNCVIAHTEHIGLGEETYNKYTTGQGCHISNGKMYWDLVYASPYLALAEGQRAYVKGWYKWLPYESL